MMDLNRAVPAGGGADLDLPHHVHVGLGGALALFLRLNAGLAGHLAGYAGGLGQQRSRRVSQACANHPHQ